MQASLVNPPPPFIDLTAEESPDEFESVVEENTYSPPSTPGTPEPGNKYWAPYVKNLREDHPDPEALSAALTRYLNNHLGRIRAEQRHRQSSWYPDWAAFIDQPPEQYPPPGFVLPGQS